MARPNAKLLGLLLLSLLNLVARCSAGKRRKAEEMHEVEGEEEEGLSGYTAGLATIGGFIVVMAIFYLINAQRTVVRKTIWEVVNNTISIFCAVFIFQTCSSIMEEYVYDPVMSWMHEDAEEKRFEVMRYMNQAEVVFWYGLLYLNVSVWSGVGQGMWVRQAIIKDKLSWAKDRNGVRIGMIFAHVAAFATMEGWGKVQTSKYRPYRNSPPKSLFCFLEALMKWYFILAVLGIFRRIVKHHGVEFWKKGQQVVLHYPHTHPRFRKYHGLEGELEEYSSEEKSWTININGHKVTAPIEHIGALAQVKYDLSEAEEKRQRSGLTKVGKQIATAVHKGQDMGRRFVESGSMHFNAHERNSGLMHEEISGHGTGRDSPFIKADDEVVVVSAHHRGISDPRRYIGRHLVVQKTCRDSNGKLAAIKTIDDESLRDAYFYNVRKDRLEFKDGDIFKSGPYPHSDPMVKYWEEQLEEGENDIAALASSFLLVQSIRFWIGGHLPKYNGMEEEGHGKDDDPLFQKTRYQVCQLYGCAFLLMVAALAHPLFVKKFSVFRTFHKLHHMFHEKRVRLAEKGDNLSWKYLTLEELLHGIKRMEEVLYNVYCFAMAWAFMYATQWSISSAEVVSKHSRYVVAILLAVFVTISVFFMIYLLDKLIRMAKQSTSFSDVDWLEKNLVCLMHSFGFLMGFTWEMCFDEAIEEVAETLSGKYYSEKMTKGLLSLVFLCVIIPPWQKFIIPMIDEKEYTLGFHVQRVIKNVKHAFEKAYKEHEGHKELEAHEKHEEERSSRHKEPKEHHALSKRQKEIRRISKHMTENAKLWDNAFVVHCSKLLKPTMKELSDSDRYIRQLIEEVNDSVHFSDQKLNQLEDPMQDLRKIVRDFGILSHRRKKIRYTFKYKFKYKKSGQEREDILRKSIEDFDSRDFKKQVSLGSEATEQDSDSAEEETGSESEEESDSGEETETHGCLVNCFLSLLDKEDGQEFKKQSRPEKGTRDLLGSSPACQESQQILARADKLVEDYDKLWEELRGLQKRVDAKFKSPGP